MKATTTVTPTTSSLLRHRCDRPRRVWLWSQCFVAAVTVVAAFGPHQPTSLVRTTMTRPTMFGGEDGVLVTSRTAGSRAAATTRAYRTRRLHASSESNDRNDNENNKNKDPMVVCGGHSTQPVLVDAIQEAVAMAVRGLPQPPPTTTTSSSDDDDNDATATTSTTTVSAIDLMLIHVSSLYDGMAPATVVPCALAAAQTSHLDVHHLVGCTVAGVISSSSSGNPHNDRSSRGLGPVAVVTAPPPVELEGIPAVAVTLLTLPDVTVRTFHVDAADVPDDGTTRTPPREWKRAVGLAGVGDWDGEDNTDDDTEDDTDDDDKDKGTFDSDPPVFLVFPSPAFSTNLDALLQGLSNYFPGSTVAGGVSSTVSSLSRARLYRWSKGVGNVQDVTFADGCVGVALQGDLRLASLMAQGAKPVGGIYQVLQANDSTIQLIVLDPVATEALEGEEGDGSATEEEEEDMEEEPVTPKSRKEELAAFYAKAQIPKPVLAEANFLMRTLSDDDQAFMRRQLLVGLDRGGPVGRTASELVRLAQGQGHRFTVHPVASAKMKDGSVTLPLGSVVVTPGTRMRFFVREPDFARQEINALWTGYKKRLLTAQFQKDDADEPNDGASPTVPFNPACCMLIPTLDRGHKFFGGKSGFESSTAARTLPGVPCVTGFFANGIVGNTMGNDDNNDDDESRPAGARESAGVQGSASGYFLLGPKSDRPVFSAAAAAAQREEEYQAQAIANAKAQAVEAEDAKRLSRTRDVANLEERAPRSPDGELILKRREVHAGRALTVSTVEWSVAEKAAKPSSALEGFMWDKETEVDRFRERVPLANLVSQWRLSVTDPKAAKPRDWVGPVQRAAAEKGFVIVPDCKRTDPVTGSLYRRYDLSKLVRDFTSAGAPAVSVNCDQILFGGSIEHITEARQASTQAAIESMSEDGVIVPPILASDLLLYPYQLYKLRLAGADAVNLIAGALAAKDLTYLTKIGSALQLQTLVTVTSEVQMEQLAALESGSVHGVIVSNRLLEDFTFDDTGAQALTLLQSDALSALRDVHGADLLVLAEGRVGVMERAAADDATAPTSTAHYLRDLKHAGASGAIVGRGLAGNGSDSVERLADLLGAVVDP